MVGRVADVIVLSSSERSFLESQVRWHRAPRSLSDRCRMILFGAGLDKKKYLGQPLEKMLDEHFLGQKNHTYGIFQMLYFAYWYESYIVGSE